MNTSTSNNTFISKFEINDKSLYVKLIWKQNDNDIFLIKIFDGTTSWSGRYSNEFAKKFKERVTVVESEDQYYENVKKALRRQENDFMYTFKPVQGDSNSFEFTWKKRSNKVTFVHGSVPVHRDENQESKDTLIDLLLQENRDLRYTIAGYQTKNDELNKDLHKCKNELGRFVNIKTSLEVTLYGKFVQLLNAKKSRIKSLEENLQKFKNITDEEHAMETELD